MQPAISQFPAAAVRLAGPALPYRRPPQKTTTSVTLRKPAAVRSRRRDDADQFFSGGGGGGVVDEGMIELRRRIHEMRAAESGWEPPAEWAAWEKEWYGSYDADVCALVGAVQAFLMSSRPGVGVGIVAAVAVSVPTTAFVLVSGLLHASQSLLSNLQH
ncbi:uncharacterized protein [Oryza sativa Japonica Group]|nr:uncharacterized protein LOC4326043 isoform X1 [Oryza sativa Japonica Group]EAY72320.1 hypothetical protein OsI_00175 [Oryza sativa Indica Group]KAF2948148.1 hypothetical protein DAI22_01g014700 [Oryza sativa Japonica Group]